MISFPVVFLLSFLSVISASVFMFIVFRKLLMAGRDRITAMYRESIINGIEGFINKPEPEFKKGLENFAEEAEKKPRKYLDVIDEYLLYVLETFDLPENERYIIIANRLDLLSDCIDQINDYNPDVSAIGSRRAGLFKYREVTGAMIKALDIISVKNQFEILMGLARMGDSGALLGAFEKINKTILINERAIIQILATFPEGGDKLELFRTMIRSKTDYIAALFLRALNRDVAMALKDDITAVMKSANARVRAAAVRSLAVMGPDAPAAELTGALMDHDWEVRALAAKALDCIVTPESTMALYNSLFDQQWWVRQNAANALVNHSGYETLFVLAAESGDEYTKDSIIYALEKSGNPMLLRAIKIMAVQA